MGITFAAGAYIEQLNQTPLNVLKATVGVWFRRSGRPASFQSFMSKHSSISSREGFGTYLDPSAGAGQDKMHVFGTAGGGASAFDISTTPQIVFDGNWHLFSANLQVTNGAANDLYLDGGNKVSANAAATWDLDAQPIRFGKDPDTFWTSWDGSLAHGFYYNEILTDAEHMALACGISPLYIRPHALLVYVPMIGPDFTANVQQIPSLAATTTSGTLTLASYEPPLGPVNEGFLFDRDWPTMTIISRRLHFTPIRSARRR